MAVIGMISMVVGGTTDTVARFVVKVDTGPAAVRYDTDAGMSSPTTSSSETVDSDGVATVEVTGLTAGTRYHWQTVDNGTTDTGTTGQFLTHPAAAGTAASFRFGVYFCAGSTPQFPADAGGELDAARISNHPMFETMRERALDEDWVMALCLGDLFYPDFGDRNTDTVANRRTFFDDLLAQSRRGPLMREVPFVYTWHDHDFGPNNTDGGYADKANTAQVYRERVPHYDLDDADAIYQSVQIGRVLIVLWDPMYDRSDVTDTDNSSKVILGSTQRTWFDNLLATTNASALVICSPDGGWNQDASSGHYSWRGYTTERATIQSIVEDRGFADATVMLKGDFHRARLDSGANNPNGGWPTMMAGPADSTPSGPLADDYDLGGRAVRGSYGVVDVRDDGDQIALTIAGYTMAGAWAWHTLNTAGSTTVRAGNPSHVLAL